MIREIKNNTANDIFVSDIGRFILANEKLPIKDIGFDRAAESTDLQTLINNGSLSVIVDGQVQTNTSAINIVQGTVDPVMVENIVDEYLETMPPITATSRYDLQYFGNFNNDNMYIPGFIGSADLTNSTASAKRAYAYPIMIEYPITVDSIALYSAAATNSVYAVSITDVNSIGYPGNILFTTGVQTSKSIGLARTMLPTPQTLQPGLYWVVEVFENSKSLRGSPYRRPLLGYVTSISKAFNNLQSNTKTAANVSSNVSDFVWTIDTSTASIPMIFFGVTSL